MCTISPELSSLHNTWAQHLPKLSKTLKTCSLFGSFIRMRSPGFWVFTPITSRERTPAIRAMHLGEVVLLASLDVLSSVPIIHTAFCAISQGVCTASGMTEDCSSLPGSSSNRARGCPVAFTGENRSREVPKLFLVKDRVGLLFFLISSCHERIVFVKR